MEIISTSSIGIAEMVDLIRVLTTTNLGYLAVSVSILALGGVAFYFFNIKPIDKKIDNQATIINDQQKEYQKIKEEIDTSLAKIKKSESKIKSILEDVERLSLNISSQADRQEEIYKYVKQQELHVRAESARTMGLICDDKMWYHRAFDWWLEAAYFYNKINDINLAIISIGVLKKILIKIKKEEKEKNTFKRYLEKELKNIKTQLEELSLRYTEDIDNIKKEIKEISGYKL